MASPGNTNPGLGHRSSVPPNTAEVRAHVRTYFSMLERELRGRTHRAHAFGRDQRAHDDDATLRIYGQIAAVLIEEGMPFHGHHQPLADYRPELRAAVATYVRNHPELLRLMEADVDDSAGLVPDLAERELDEIAARAPEQGEIPRRVADGTPGSAISGVDFLEREQRNRSLASAGELFVIRYEIARLRAAGADVYADAIEHVSAEQGAGGGYDIHSYDVDGHDRFIKVKTTRFRRETPFTVSANEIAAAATQREHFWLYRVFDFRGDPHLYGVNGALQEHFQLEAIAYRATPR